MRRYKDISKERAKEIIEENFRFIESVLASGKEVSEEKKEEKKTSDDIMDLVLTESGELMESEIDSSVKLEKPKMNLMTQFYQSIYGTKGLINRNFQFIESVLRESRSDVTVSNAARVRAREHLISYTPKSINLSKIARYEFPESKFTLNTATKIANFFPTPLLKYFEEMPDILQYIFDPVPEIELRFDESTKNVSYFINQDNFHDLGVLEESPSSQETKDIIVEFCNQHNIPYIFPEKYSVLYKTALNSGGLCVVALNSHGVQILRSGKDLTERDIQSISNDKNSIPFLICSPDYLRRFSFKDLDVLLRHEFGHIKTFGAMTDIEKVINAMKIGLIVLFCNFENYGEDIKLSLYYQLKNERMANESGGVDYKELIRIVSGKYPAVDVNQLRIANILYAPISMQVAKIRTKILYNHQVTNEEYLLYCNAIKDICKICLKDKALEMALAMIEAYSENIDQNLFESKKINEAIVNSLNSNKVYTESFVNQDMINDLHMLIPLPELYYLERADEQFNVNLYNVHSEISVKKEECSGNFLEVTYNFDFLPFDLNSTFDIFKQQQIYHKTKDRILSFCKERNIEVVFVSEYGDLYTMICKSDGIMCTWMGKKILSDFINAPLISADESIDIDDVNSNSMTMIVAPQYLMRQIENFEEKLYMRLEYHIALANVYKKITPRMYLETETRIALLYQLANLEGIPEEDVYAIYYFLPVISQALHDAHIEMPVFVNNILGVYPSQSWRSLNLAQLIDMPIPENIIRIRAKMRSGFYVATEDKITYLDEISRLAKTLISEDSYNKLIEEISPKYNHLLNSKSQPVIESTHTFIDYSDIEVDESLLWLSEDFSEYDMKNFHLNRKFLTEDGQVSLSRIMDGQESDKNGLRRKRLYIAFIDYAKAYKPRNTFGSVFDKDAFSTIYPFVPHEMRYFYRLANPLLCVLPGNLTFFALSELKSINEENKQLDQYLVFAAANDELRVFNMKDKKIYLAKYENEEIKTQRILGETFDLYLQSMMGGIDYLNAPIEKKEEATPEK